MYSGEYDACDVTLSVYPHRASVKNMPDHGGNRTYDLWNTSPMLCQLSYAVRSVEYRASLKNMPDHGGNRTYDLWNTSPMQNISFLAKELLKEGSKGADVNEGRFVLNIDVLFAL